jgi:hypothetical protein
MTRTKLSSVRRRGFDAAIDQQRISHREMDPRIATRAGGKSKLCGQFRFRDQLASIDDDCIPDKSWVSTMGSALSTAVVVEGSTICPDKTGKLLEGVVENHSEEVCSGVAISESVEISLWSWAGSSKISPKPAERTWNSPGESKSTGFRYISRRKRSFIIRRDNLLFGAGSTEFFRIAGTCYIASRQRARQAPSLMNAKT